VGKVGVKWSSEVVYLDVEVGDVEFLALSESLEVLALGAVPTGIAANSCELYPLRSD
jgi:hypothetical protein